MHVLQADEIGLTTEGLKNQMQAINLNQREQNLYVSSKPHKSLPQSLVEV